MAENQPLTKTEITIQDYNNNGPVVFSNLTLTESLISVNNFSFSVRPAETNGSFSAILDFKKKVLGKNVQIEFKDGDGNTNHKFKGIVLQVNSSLSDDHFYEFNISGSGDFCKINEIAECHSFYKKKLDAIITKAFEKSSLKDKVKKAPQTSKELHYIVQYNQTLFSFMSSLAMRFGEWMFYDGENLQFGKKPEGDVIELNSPADVSNLNISAHAIKKPESAVATDIFKSTTIKSSTIENAPDDDFIKAGADSGETIFENPGGNIFLSAGFNQDDSDDKYKLEQQAILSSSVFITGNTRNNKVFIGKKIKIKDAQDDAGRTYIITQSQHSVSNFSNYINYFTAVPVEVLAPPYTDPLFAPKATPQAAIVTDNEDDAGLSRVKVKFPWMADDEKTPWISVSVPHAGKDKGFRFLPEKDDEVLIDFWDNNAELPFVSGSIYTDKNKSGIAESGNNIKMIGSRSGRRLQIDDDNGLLYLEDNFPDQNPLNIVSLHRKDTDKKIMIESKESNDQYTAIRLNNQESLDLGLVVGGDLLLEINMKKEGPMISIKSKGDIEIKADQNVNINGSEINLQATNIKITADSNLEMKGSAEAKLEGAQVKIDGSGQLEAKGATAKIEGSGMLQLKGGAVASLEAGLVKIN